jgi:putative SOS response-associated peptidase YedK
MCGRFTLRANLQEVVEQFQLEAVPDSLPDRLSQARYNIAPTQPVTAIRCPKDAQHRELVGLRWGLIPSWAKDAAIGNQTINARAETVAEKPAFRSAFKSRRCLIVADGYYEWQKQGKQKQPYFFHRRDDRPFAFAGLYEHWSGGAGAATIPSSSTTMKSTPSGSTPSPWESCTIITTSANEFTQPIHDRMPVILQPADFLRWLDPQEKDRDRLESLLRPYAGDDFVATPVSTHVNNPRHEDPECLQ